MYSLAFIFLTLAVYRDHCPGDPTCRAFGFLDREMTPSVMMERSLLYRLHGHKIKPGVVAPEDKFQEVYRSKYGKVRIFKVMGISEKSKEWVADPANRVCDVPGSWFCPGQYPPGLSEILSSKKDFQQLEDFNRGKNDDDYQKQYFEDLFDPDSAKRKHLLKEREQSNIERKAATPDEELKKQAIKVDEIYNTWEDTEDTTLMWKLISTNAIEDLKAWLEAEPHKAFIRSKDGRGPMFWSFELRHEEATKLLMKAGVPHTDRDAKGMTPVDLLEGGK
jgi:dolichyl-diphosphooligosaccharide--protein glycosyltransferase